MKHLILFLIVCLMLSKHSFAQIDSTKLIETENRIKKEERKADKLKNKIDKKQKKMERQKRKMERKEAKRDRKLKRINKEEKKLDKLKSDSSSSIYLPKSKPLKYIMPLPS